MWGSRELSIITTLEAVEEGEETERGEGSWKGIATGIRNVSVTLRSSSSRFRRERNHTSMVMARIRIAAPMPPPISAPMLVDDLDSPTAGVPDGPPLGVGYSVERVCMLLTTAVGCDTVVILLIVSNIGSSLSKPDTARTGLWLGSGAPVI